MPHFEAADIIKWLHLIALAMGGGAAMVALILTGFEAGRDDLQGLTAMLWKRTVAWAFRIAVVLGLILLAMRIHQGAHPFAANYLHWKLALVLVLLMVSEMAPRGLRAARTGTALLAFLLFLVITFISVNRSALGYKTRPAAAAIPSIGTVVKGQ